MLTGWKIGTGLAHLWYGKNTKKINKAFTLLNQYEDQEGQDMSLLVSAYNIFLEIDEDDKDYAIAASLYGLAKCHTYMAEFESAYACLRKLQRIEIGTFTSQPELILDYQLCGDELKLEIEELEDEYNKNKSGSSKKNESGSSWTSILVFLLVTLLCISAIAFIVFKFIM